MLSTTSAPSHPSRRVDSGNQLSKQIERPKRPTSGIVKTTNSRPHAQASYGLQGKTFRSDATTCPSGSKTTAVL